jgi:hypothetical protein
MQATTATFFAGGSGRSLLSKPSAYLLLFSMSSSVVLIGASVQKIGSEHGRGNWMASQLTVCTSDSRSGGGGDA